MSTNELLIVAKIVADSCGRCYSELQAHEGTSACVRGWMVAIGSILVVIVAVFQAWIRGFLKAKLVCDITNASPHFIVEECGGLVGRLWMEVRNVRKRLDAESVRVSVEEIHVRDKAGDLSSYGLEMKIHPRHLCWSALEDSRETSLHIAAESREFAQIAEIVCLQATMQNQQGQGDPPAQSSAPEFLIVSKNQKFKIEGEFQDVVVRLWVTGATVQSQSVYLKISWQGKNAKHLKESSATFLSCAKLTEKEYIGLIGGGRE